MDKVKTPTGEEFLSGTLGEVFPMCFEKQKQDALRFVCLRDPAKCPQNSVCFVAMQRAIKKLFDANPEVIGGHFTFTTVTDKYLTKVDAKTMLHSLFLVKDDGYSPVGGSEKNG